MWVQCIVHLFQYSRSQLGCLFSQRCIQNQRKDWLPSTTVKMLFSTHMGSQLVPLLYQHTPRVVTSFMRKYKHLRNYYSLMDVFYLAITCFLMQVIVVGLGKRSSALSQPPSSLYPSPTRVPHTSSLYLSTLVSVSYNSSLTPHHFCVQCNIHFYNRDI